VFAVDLDLDLASKRTSVQTTQIATWVQAEVREPEERGPNQEQGHLVTWCLFK
jgi:hypothetical protein